MPAKPPLRLPPRGFLLFCCLALLTASVAALALIPQPSPPPVAVASPAASPPPSSSPPAPSQPAEEPEPPSQEQPPPPLTSQQVLHAELLAALRATSASDFSAVVEVEDVGRVLDFKGGVPRMPASTLKLYTGLAALRVLGADHRYATAVRSTAPGSDGVIDGDLVLAAGGDPSLTRDHLKALAAGVAAKGITKVTGDLYADDTRYDRVRAAPGWRPTWFPRYVGSLSALTVDRNAWRDDVSFYAEPATANAGLLREELAARGVQVLGADRLGKPSGDTSAVVRHRSAPLGEMMKEVLAISDNVYSELILKELGRTIGSPTTSGGLAVVNRVAGDLGIPPAVQAVDGSGLSFHDRDTAYNQIQLLKRAEQTATGDVFRSSLARSCTPEVGFFGTRLCGTPAAGKVFAKTGVHVKMRALSGYTTTASGKRVFFAFNLSGVEDVDAAWKGMMRALVAVNTYTG